MESVLSALSSSPATAAPGGGEDFRLGVYRTRDNINNFRVRIRLRKVTPAASPLASSLIASGSNESVRSASSSGNDNVDVVVTEDMVVGWQQKVFSKAEVGYYSGKKEADFEGDVLGRKFLHDVKEGGGKASKIFTLVDGELVRPADTDELADEQMIPYIPLTTNPREEANLLAQMMSDGLRRRRHLSSGFIGPPYSSVADKSTVPTANLVLEDPSKETQARLHTLSGHQLLMVVRLDLSEEEEENKGSKEYMDLCLIRYGTNGVLEVSPDFTIKKPYRIESPHGGAYEYWLENVSLSMQRDAQKEEARMLNDVCARLTQQRLSVVGQDFELAPKHTFRLLVNAEIVSAANFEYDDGLFIHYFVELPLGWSSAKDYSQLCGMTHACRSSSNDIAHFCHTFSLDLYFDLNRFDLDRESLPKWPQIFFEVVSVDSWSRCRCGEGYGFASIPYSAGSYDLTVDTWRPLGGRKDEMRRYFVGGTPELDDLGYAGTPGDLADSKILSRFGFRTAAAGSVRLRLNVAHQSRAFMKGKKELRLMDRLSSETLFGSVAAVVEAFEKARERMARVIAARGYDVNLDKGS